MYSLFKILPCKNIVDIIFSLVYRKVVQYREGYSFASLVVDLQWLPESLEKAMPSIERCTWQSANTTQLIAVKSRKAGRFTLLLICSTSSYLPRLLCSKKSVSTDGFCWWHRASNPVYVKYYEMLDILIIVLLYYYYLTKENPFYLQCSWVANILFPFSGPFAFDISFF